MVLNVGRTKPENGQEQPTTDMTTTKQREVTYSIINANNGIYLEKKYSDKSAFKKFNPSLFDILNLHRSQSIFSSSR